MKYLFIKALIFLTGKDRLSDIEINKGFLNFLLVLFVIYSGAFLFVWLAIRHPAVLLISVLALIAIPLWYASGEPPLFNQKKK